MVKVRDGIGHATNKVGARQMAVGGDEHTAHIHGSGSGNSDHGSYSLRGVASRFSTSRPIEFPS